MHALGLYVPYACRDPHNRGLPLPPSSKCTVCPHETHTRTHSTLTTETYNSSSTVNCFLDHWCFLRLVACCLLLVTCSAIKDKHPHTFFYTCCLVLTFAEAQPWRYICPDAAGEASKQATKEGRHGKLPEEKIIVRTKLSQWARRCLRQESTRSPKQTHADSVKIVKWGRNE